MMVSFGNASGAVEPIAPLVLNQKGSLFLTRPKLGDHTASQEELHWRASDVLGWIATTGFSSRWIASMPSSTLGRLRKILRAARRRESCCSYRDACP